MTGFLKSWNVRSDCLVEARCQTNIADSKVGGATLELDKIRTIDVQQVSESGPYIERTM